MQRMSAQDTEIRTRVTNESDPGLTRNTTNQTMMERISTTDAPGLNRLVEFSIVGPIILVVISIVIVCLVLSFFKHRCDRQQRRKEASLGQGRLSTSKARMLAYSLPYNVLDFRKRFSMDDGDTPPTQSHLPPAIGAVFRAGFGAGSPPPGRSPRSPAEDHRWETAPLPRTDEPSPARSGLEQLGVRGLTGNGGHPGGVFETRYLELRPLGNALGDVHAAPQPHKSPVYESKSRMKRLKKRSIRPFIMGEFHHRHRFNAEGEREGDTRGIMCISQGQSCDSSTTSTFQMRLDQQ